MTYQIDRHQFIENGPAIAAAAAIARIRTAAFYAAIEQRKVKASQPDLAKAA